MNEEQRKAQARRIAEMIYFINASVRRELFAEIADELRALCSDRAATAMDAAARRY